MSFTCGTDLQGDSDLLNQLRAKQYPWGASPKELTAQAGFLKQLTELTGFTGIVNEFFAVGDIHLAEPTELKAAERERKARLRPKSRPTKRRHSDTLREKDPW